MNVALNTFDEAAKKLRVSHRTIRRLVEIRDIDVLEISSRKKFITDEAIEKFKRRHTEIAL